MDRPITLDELQDKCENLEIVDEWRLGGNRHGNHYSKGSKARKFLQPYSVGKKHKKIPQSNEKRKLYKEKKKEVKEKMKVLEKEFDESLPSEIKSEDKKKLKAALRLLTRQERAISAPLHLIFELKKLSWNDVIFLYKKWITCSLRETAFPAFIWRTYDVIKGSETGWDTIPIVANHVQSSCEKWVRSDFWPFVDKPTKIRWRRAVDGFVQSIIFRRHNTWLYPFGSKVYFNPPFSDYKEHFDHLWPQFLSGTVTDILLVMFRTKWTGGNDGTCQWIQRLQTYKNKKVIEFPYNFWKPDGSRHKGEKNLICVHIFHD